MLGAAQYNGKPSPVFRARLEKAAELYHGNTAPVVLVTGGIGNRDTVSEAEVGRRYLTLAWLAGGSGHRPPARRHHGGVHPVSSAAGSKIGQASGWFW